MPHQTFVVIDNGTGLYLISFNLGNASQSSFGNLENAIEFETLEQAENIAAQIGPGTGGLPRPK